MKKKNTEKINLEKKDKDINNDIKSVEDRTSNNKTVI